MTLSRIQILDDLVVNQIAAGEVVERPTSVVKELVENSIDAGASEILVVISNGGMTALEVIDNGSGMTREECLLAIQRFGTSKISSADELFQLNSFGFRGEALPSIASVSKFMLTSSADGVKGTRVKIEGGEVTEVLDLPAEQGTRVAVMHLFYNVPARKRFLKSESYEGGLIKTVLTDFAVAYPQIRFSLISDGSQSLQLHPDSDFFARGKKLKLGGERQLEVLHQQPGFTVQALLSRPTEGLGSANRLRLLVNRRSVRDKLLLRAVKEGFGTFLGPGRYPHGVLSLELPPSEVDVNVHPQKSEVRFRESSQIFSLVRNAIHAAVQNVTVGQLIAAGGEGSVVAATNSGYWGGGYAQQRPLERQAPIFFSGSTPLLDPQLGERKPLELALRELRFIAQVFRCYLLLEGSERIFVVDMHAAHERVVFARIKEQLSSGAVRSQSLLLPEMIEIPEDQLEQFLRFAPALTRLGFETAHFGERTVVVRSVPSILGMTSAAQFFRELPSAPAWSEWLLHFNEHLDEVVSRLACHGSIRSGRLLEREEVYQLLADLEEVESGAFCPHGRPVVREITKGELEDLFGR